METTKDKVLQIASEIFGVDKSVLTEETNINTLSILCRFLIKTSQNERQGLIVSKDGLDSDILEVNGKYKDRKLELDISTLFVGSDTVEYFDEKGRDGFWEYQIIPVPFIMEIENKFEIDVKDEEAGKFETLGDVIHSIEKSLERKQRNKKNGV